MCTLREECRLRVFENRIFRRKFEPKRDENGEWKRHHNEECAGHVDRMEEGRSVFKVLTGKPTGKIPLGRPRCRWEDNIRMELEEIGINAGNWFDSAQDRDYFKALVIAALNLRVP